jgi:hypothetical protein
MRTRSRESHGMEPNFVPNSRGSIYRVSERVNRICGGPNRYLHERDRPDVTGNPFSQSANKPSRSGLALTDPLSEYQGEGMNRCLSG